jgi:hypothetical protein
LSDIPHARVGAPFNSAHLQELAQAVAIPIVLKAHRNAHGIRQPFLERPFFCNPNSPLLTASERLMMTVRYDLEQAIEQQEGEK